MLRNITRIFLISIVTIHVVNADGPIKESIFLTLPKIEWVLDVNGANLVTTQKEITPDGKNARFQAIDTRTGITISGFLEEHAKPGTAKQCREFYWAKAKESPFKKDNIVQSNFGEMATVEYIVKEYEGIKVDQKNVNAYLTRGKFWMDVHLSKTDYKEGEKKLFDSILDNIRIIDSKKNYKSRVSYKISNQGVLKLNVPGSWHDQIWQEAENSPVQVELIPPTDASAKVLITVVWNERKDDDFNTTEYIRNFVVVGGNESLSQAVEDVLDVRELKGVYGSGYFFTLTDKSPKPGEYKYMTQGAFGVKKFFLLFTILTNEKDSEVSKVALDIIAGSEDASENNNR